MATALPLPLLLSKTYDLIWSPTGQRIGTVQARTARAAVRKAPAPYRRFLGEIYAIPASDA